MTRTSGLTGVLRLALPASLCLTLLVPAAGAQRTLKILSGDKQTISRSMTGQGAGYNGGAATMGVITLVLADAAGKGVPSITVCPSITAGNIQHSIGGCSATNASGTVTFGPWIFWNGTGPVSIDIFADRVLSPNTNSVTATLTVNDPVVVATGVTITKTAGDNQTKPYIATQPDLYQQGQAFDPLSVKVVDASGKAVANAPVLFSCPRNMGQPGVPMCAMTQYTNQANYTVNTGADGVATLNAYHSNSVVLYYGTGTALVTASNGGAGVSFTLTGTPSGAVTSGTLKIQSGDKQTISRSMTGDGAGYNGGAATMGVITLLLSDATGKGIPSITICPSITTGLQHSVGGCSATNASGTVTFGPWIFWSGTGPVSIAIGADRVQSPGTNTVTATLTVNDPVVVVTGVTITKTAGDNQTKPYIASQPDLGQQGQAFDPLSVKVVDASGKAVANAPVLFSCPRNMSQPGVPMCAMTQYTNQANYTVNTGADGVATLNAYHGNSVVLYYGSGTALVTASNGGAGVTFTLTGNPVPPIGVLTIKSGDNQEIRRLPATAGPERAGTATMHPITILLADPSGKPIPGISICHTVHAPSGLRNYGIKPCATTSATGTAEFGPGTFYDAAGAVTIDFTADPVTSPGSKKVIATLTVR